MAKFTDILAGYYIVGDGGSRCYVCREEIRPQDMILSAVEVLGKRLAVGLHRWCFEQENAKEQTEKPNAVQQKTADGSEDRGAQPNAASPGEPEPALHE